MEHPDEFLLEKLKIADRLSAVESQVARLVAHAETEQDNIAHYHNTLMKILDKHEKELFGNGNPGLKTEIDRLNQIEKARRWHIRTLWITTLGILTGLMAKVLVHHFHIGG